MLSPLDDLGSLNLSLGDGLRAFSLPLRLVEASSTCGGKRVPEGLQEIGAVIASLKVIPVPLGQGLPVVEGRDGRVSDPAIRVARKPPQRPGAGIWAEGHLESDLRIGRASVFCQPELCLKNRGIELGALNSARSSHREKWLWIPKSLFVNVRIGGGSDSRSFIAEVPTVLRLGAAAASLTMGPTHRRRVVEAEVVGENVWRCALCSSTSRPPWVRSSGESGGTIYLVCGGCRFSPRGVGCFWWHARRLIEAALSVGYRTC